MLVSMLKLYIFLFLVNVTMLTMSIMTILYDLAEHSSVDLIMVCTAFGSIFGILVCSRKYINVTILNIDDYSERINSKRNLINILTTLVVLIVLASRSF